jgi:hypothetical protein
MVCGRAAFRDACCRGGAAFLFFRDALLNSVIEVYQVANVPSGRVGRRAARASTYTDLILMHLLETFEEVGD